MDMYGGDRMERKKVKMYQSLPVQICVVNLLILASFSIIMDLVMERFHSAVDLSKGMIAYTHSLMLEESELKTEIYDYQWELASYGYETEASERKVIRENMAGQAEEIGTRISEIIESLEQYGNADSVSIMEEFRAGMEQFQSLAETVVDDFDTGREEEAVALLSGDFSQAFLLFKDGFVRLEASMDGIIDGCDNWMREKMTDGMIFSIVGSVVVI
ncbi:MAG: hypothetical protein IJ733_01885, partial [Lachnospiraceae bacterium]|nr:hypothetical protein [Lachnospiraceae bacterium]